jgi:hypothetical protein
MSPRRIALLALAIFAVTATVALAYEPGHYHGHTEGLYFSPTEREYRSATVSFDIHNGRVFNIRFEIRVECSDDSHRSFVVKHGGSLPIGEEGRFHGSATTNGGTGTDRFSGRVVDERVSGAVSRTIKLTKSGKESSTGMQCSSGRVEYKAHEVHRDSGNQGGESGSGK